jgi:hypothetical protein
VIRRNTDIGREISDDVFHVPGANVRPPESRRGSGGRGRGR